MSETKGKSTGRPCSICSHEQVKEINSKIFNGQSFRSISLNFGMSDPSVGRHAENCLGLSVAAMIQERKLSQAINVHKEFAEQLAFAKQLREAAREYLSSETDPLRLVLIPRADETDIAYFDFADTTALGEPKKKTATLHALLAKAEGGLNIEADKITIKHVDMRKFALDAINTTDACIDKFAKLSGAYQKDAANERDLDAVVKAYRSFLDQYPDASAEDKAQYLDWFATSANVDKAAIQRQIQNVTEVLQ